MSRQATVVANRMPCPQAGLTLIETLVTIAIYGLIMVAVISLTVLLFQESEVRPAALTSIDQARITGREFANEVRDAQTGEDGAYALGEASSTEIILYSPYGAQSTTTIRRIRYYLSGGTLWRGIITPSGNPPSYSLASEQLESVIVGVFNTSTPPFLYYDGSYAGTSSPLTQPVNVTNVTFVQLDLDLSQQVSRTASTSYVFTAGAAVRSLKTNLGN